MCPVKLEKSAVMAGIYSPMIARNPISIRSGILLGLLRNLVHLTGIGNDANVPGKSP